MECFEWHVGGSVRSVQDVSAATGKLLVGYW